MAEFEKALEEQKLLVEQKEKAFKDLELEIIRLESQKYEAAEGASDLTTKM